MQTQPLLDGMLSLSGSSSEDGAEYDGSKSPAAKHRLSIARCGVLRPLPLLLALCTVILVIVITTLPPVTFDDIKGFHTVAKVRGTYINICILIPVSCM
jgi:hypothetical protein